MVYLNYLLCEVLSVRKGNKMSDDYVLVLQHTPVVEAVKLCKLFKFKKIDSIKFLIICPFR